MQLYYWYWTIYLPLIAICAIVIIPLVFPKFRERWLKLGRENSKKDDSVNKKGINNVEYWIYRILGMSGGVIAIITLYLPWYSIVSSGLTYTITPFYISNAMSVDVIYYWDFYSVVTDFFSGDLISLISLIVITICYPLIIIASILSILKVSRTASTLLITTIVVSVFLIGAMAIVGSQLGVIPYNIIPQMSIPFFGMDGNDIWGFNIGWFLSIFGAFLTLFVRRLDKTKKEEFDELWKEKVKEMQD